MSKIVEKAKMHTERALAHGEMTAEEKEERLTRVRWVTSTRRPSTGCGSSTRRRSSASDSSMSSCVRTKLVSAQLDEAAKVLPASLARLKGKSDAHEDEVV